jgi:hypothetical protein
MRRLQQYSSGGRRAFSIFSGGWDPSTSWTGELIDETDLSLAPLPWGLVAQDRIFDEVLPQLARTLVEEGSIAGALIKGEADECALLAESEEDAHRQEQLRNLRKWMERRGVNARVGGRLFHMAGTTHSDFCVGAKIAYQHLAELSSSNGSDFSEADLMTPMLAELLAQSQKISLEEHGVQPTLTIQQPTSGGNYGVADFHPIMATVIKVEVEEGRAHKQGQVFGMWDLDEIKSQLMDGIKVTSPNYMLCSVLTRPYLCWLDMR